MFSNLTKLDLERTGKQALGFYLAYLILGIILGALTGGIYALITGDQSFEGGVRAGQIMAILYCLGLAIAVANYKGLFSSFKVILLVVISGVLALFLGALGGLIPVAYLSTTSNSHNESFES